MSARNVTVSLSWDGRPPPTPPAHPTLKSGSRPSPGCRVIISTSGQMSSEIDWCLVAAEKGKIDRRVVVQLRHGNCRWMNEWTRSKGGISSVDRVICRGTGNLSQSHSLCLLITTQCEPWGPSVCCAHCSVQCSVSPGQYNHTNGQAPHLYLGTSQKAIVNLFAACLLDRSSHRLIMKLIFRPVRRKEGRENGRTWKRILKAIPYFRQIIPSHFHGTMDCKLTF